MAKIIENADVMEVLELRGNTVGVGAGKRLAHALEFHPELKVILPCENKSMNYGNRTCVGPISDSSAENIPIRINSFYLSL